MSSEFESQILTGGKGDKVKKAVGDHIGQHRDRLQKAELRNQILANAQGQK